MVLVKLEGNKKRLVDFLLNGERPFNKIVDFFGSSSKSKRGEFRKLKSPKKNDDGISRAAVYKMVHSLNPSGLISFRTDSEDNKMVILNKEKLVEKYASDRFLFHIVLTAVALPITLTVAWMTTWWYFYGSASVIFPVFAYLSFLVFKTSRMKDYFYDKEAKKEEETALI